MLRSLNSNVQWWLARNCVERGDAGTPDAAGRGVTTEAPSSIVDNARPAPGYRAGSRYREPVDADGWDQRYAAADLVWSAGPNRFVAEEHLYFDQVQVLTQLGLMPEPAAATA